MLSDDWRCPFLTVYPAAAESSRVDTGSSLGG
jgi:hypothetical protein